MLSLLGYETNITLSSANGIGCLEPGGTDSSRSAFYIAQQALAAHIVKSSSPGYIFHFICRERLQYTRQWIIMRLQDNVIKHENNY